MKYAGCYSIAAVAASAGVEVDDVINAILDGALTYDKKLNFIRHDAKMTEYITAKGKYEMSKPRKIHGLVRIGVYSNLSVGYKNIGIYHIAIIRNTPLAEPIYKTIIGDEATKVINEAIDYCIGRTDAATRSHKSEGEGYALQVSFTYNELLYMRDALADQPRLLYKINKYIKRSIKKRKDYERDDSDKCAADGSEPTAEGDR